MAPGSESHVISRAGDENSGDGGPRAVGSWEAVAENFAGALRTPTAPVPDQIEMTGGAPSLKRFNVYRNNVASSLVSAIAATYPVVEALVGEEFFAGMARVFVQDNIPASPVLLRYGAGFAEFVAGFEPAEFLPFLSDVARVEWAFNQAYHAADAAPIEIERLAEISPARYDALYLCPHPSMRLVVSDWPAISIWHAHQHDDPTGQLAEAIKRGGECGALVRPGLDVNAMILPEPAFRLLEALIGGATLSRAVEQLGEAEQSELGAMLAALFGAGMFAGLRVGDADMA